MSNESQWFDNPFRDRGDVGGSGLALIVFGLILVFGINLLFGSRSEERNSRETNNGSSLVSEESDGISFAGKIIPEMDLHVFGRPSDISTLAFYGLIHGELGFEDVLRTDLERIQSYYEENQIEKKTKNDDAVARRREALVIMAGALGVESGEIVYPSDLEKVRLEELISRFD